MDFGYVWSALRSGRKVRLAGWLGYWAWENGTIMMHCADGSVIDIRKTDDPSYTFSNIALDNWEVVEEEQDKRMCTYYNENLMELCCTHSCEGDDTDSLEKLGDDYGLTPAGVRHAIEAYQKIICEITGGKLSKLAHDAYYVLEEAEEHYKQKYGK